jgi:hypothetical protein
MAPAAFMFWGDAGAMAVSPDARRATLGYTTTVSSEDQRPFSSSHLPLDRSGTLLEGHRMPTGPPVIEHDAAIVVQMHSAIFQ